MASKATIWIKASYDSTGEDLCWLQSKQAEKNNEKTINAPCVHETKNDQHFHSLVAIKKEKKKKCNTQNINSCLHLKDEEQSVHTQVEETNNNLKRWKIIQSKEEIQNWQKISRTQAHKCILEPHLQKPWFVKEEFLTGMKTWNVQWARSHPQWK